MKNYKTRIIIGFVIINFLLGVGIFLSILGSIENDLNMSLTALFFFGIFGVMDVVYLIFVLRRTAKLKQQESIQE